MSINTVHAAVGDASAPLLLPGEKSFTSQPRVRAHLAWGSGSLSCSNGQLHLTNQRIIYIRSTTANASFTSLDVPVSHMKEAKLKQPWFGANEYEFYAIPVVGGGLPKPALVRFVFNEGGAFEFSSMVRQLRERMNEMDGTPEVLEPLPAYEPPPASADSATEHSSEAGSSQQQQRPEKARYLDEPPAYSPPE